MGEFPGYNPEEDKNLNEEDGDNREHDYRNDAEKFRDLNGFNTKIKFIREHYTEESGGGY